MTWRPAWVSGPLGRVVDVDPVSGIRWVYIPAGFVTLKDEYGTPEDQIVIERPFLMAETPVTQGQWVRVMSSGLIVNNPSKNKGGPDFPVENVTALQADEFSRRVGGRLPTEEEWHYAALGGKEEDPYGPILDIAWVKENSERRTHPVGQKLPNGFGLYDMLGNVAHWTSSRVGADRVIRGGGFGSYAAALRSSDRRRDYARYANDNLGFRPVKDLPSTYGKTRVELLEMDAGPETRMAQGRSERVRMIELDGYPFRRGKR